MVVFMLYNNIRALAKLKKKGKKIGKLRYKYGKFRSFKVQEFQNQFNAIVTGNRLDELYISLGRTLYSSPHRGEDEVIIKR